MSRMAKPERWLSFLIILLGAEGLKDDTDAVAVVLMEDQDRLIQDRHMQCLTRMINENNSNFAGPYCDRVWDDIMCWPPTSAGTIQELPCPDYVNGFFKHRYATKKCTVNGTWYIHPQTNQTWTNLTQCISNGANCIQYDAQGLIAAHMGRLRLMYNIGYGISLISLLLAVTIMLLFKKLHCPRNFIHINLFVSFILRATISFVKENVLVNGVGFPSDIKIGPCGKLEFLNNGMHWECRLFFSVFNYILCANYMWIFAEGLYLHMLISVAVFSEKSSSKWLLMLGWGTPVLFVGPWVVVRATLENVLCWNTHPNHNFFWIIKGPLCASVIINFIFFLNIIRVLFTKLTAFNAREVGNSRYR
ncbi:hypothetical protein CHS0354_019760 [Potamilus streckersoni]|uniref:Secretin receptor n=1 Tax=Potamilus streckersoni TaxID=2493646 RepID=A0AAE0S9L4_9BIVA|nr:hypothetical protein CHS0354_019760 [Potamilus streckersoni]